MGASSTKRFARSSIFRYGCLGIILSKSQKTTPLSLSAKGFRVNKALCRSKNENYIVSTVIYWYSCLCLGASISSVFLKVKTTLLWTPCNWPSRTCRFIEAGLMSPGAHIYFPTHHVLITYWLFKILFIFVFDRMHNMYTTVISDF